MTKEMDFFIFLLEHYSAYKNTSADLVLKKWQQLNLTDLIFDMYPLYHIERLENAYDDIDELVQEREREKA